LVDLGDTWMTDKHHPDYTSALNQYQAQRYYFGTLCKSSSLFLTLGNHDGEASPQQKIPQPLVHGQLQPERNIILIRSPMGFIQATNKRKMG